MVFPITAYDRPSVAAANLLEGDLRGAGLALTAPEALGPSKRSSLYEKIFGNLSEMADTNPVLKGIMSVATDPLTIISLFVSSRFPIVGAKKMFQYGKRHAGYLHRFGLLEGLFGRAERLFANTGIPDLFLSAVKGQHDFGTKWGTKKLATWLDEFKQKSGHDLTTDEALTLGAKLAKLDSEPLAGTSVPILGRIKLDPNLQRLYTKMREDFFPQFYDEVVAPMMAQSSQGKKKLAEIMATNGIDVENFTDLIRKGKIREYFPRTLIRTPGLANEFASMLVSRAKGDPSTFRELVGNMAKSFTSGHTKTRWGILTPNLDELARVGNLNPKAVAQMNAAIETRKNYVHRLIMEGVDSNTGKKTDTSLWEILHADKNAYLKMDEARALLRKHGFPTSQYGYQWEQIAQKLSAGSTQEVGNTISDMVRSASTKREFSVAFTPVMQNYMYSFARPFVWSTHKIGKNAYDIPEGIPLRRAFDLEMKKMANPEAVKILKSDYLPVLEGTLTDGQASSMLRWSSFKLKALDSLDGGTLSKVVPKTLKTKLKSMLLNEKGEYGYLNAQSKVAGHFYYAALGFNPGSAFQNLLQPVITTIPTVGVGPFFQGVERTVQKLTDPKKGYFSLRSKGMEPDVALERAFPEFVKAGMEAEPLSKAILRDSLESFWQGAQNLPAIGGRMGKKSRFEGLKRAAMWMFSGSEKFNRLVTFEAGMAKALRDGLVADDALNFAGKVVRATQFPAGPGQMPRILMKLSPAWRQFLYFPIRYAGFLGESTLFGGADKRNWGTIARSVAASAVTYNFAKEAAGLDLSRSLMLGALPFPEYENSPFYPLPVVPPIASVAGNLVKAAATQSMDPLSQSAALMVPGGVQARRLYRTFAPKYAKYDEQTVDGKIPVYGSNQALIGNFSKWDLLKKAVGFQPADMASEREAVAYLLRQRDNIREIRRQYVEAMVRGDMEEAQRINESFKRQYPQLGGIQLKQSDIRAAKDRRTFSRIGRLLRTMPSEYRDEFAGVVSTAMSSYTVDQFPMSEPEPTMGYNMGMNTSFQPAGGGFLSP